LKLVESSVTSAFMQFVLRLNETLFRPVFFKIVDWASLNSINQTSEVTGNQLFFYFLVDALLAKLKVGYTLFFL
jgi:U3 small nucleolar RNA-associated protein 10